MGAVGGSAVMDPDSAASEAEKPVESDKKKKKTWQWQALVEYECEQMERSREWGLVHHGKSPSSLGLWLHN